MIIDGMHTACGQTPRAPDLLGIEWENGSFTERGIYVWNGSMVYLTRHHKAKRSTNREFIVVRFMPARLAHVVYKHVVYIRRFLDMLDRERSPYSAVVASQKWLLFRSRHTPDKPLDTSRLTAILRKATGEVWGQPANSRLYRQLTVGITEKHVQEIHQPFNRFDDKSAAADMNVVFAWQSGHRPIQRATTYGLNGDFPTKLQPGLLRAYEWVSTRWHEFIHQSSKVMPSPKPTKESWKQPAPKPSARVQPVKRKLSQTNRDPSDTVRGGSRKRRLQSPETPERAESALIRSIRPFDAVVARIDAWRMGEVDRPMSDNESDSSIDWDEADMTPCEATGGSWASWRRHNARIEAKIEKTKQLCEFLDEKDLAENEREIFQTLRKWLEEWRGGCVVCHFLPTVSPNSHRTEDCKGALGAHIRSLASRFQARMSQLAAQQTLCCPWCLVPRIICDRWVRGAANRWTESGKECQYHGVIIPAMLVMVECDIRFRDTVDTWMDSLGVHSRNLDKVCQWLSGRRVGDEPHAIRIVKAFLLLRHPWVQRWRGKVGYGLVPDYSWISSTRDEEKANEMADKAAYQAREDERQHVLARNRREGRD